MIEERADVLERLTTALGGSGDMEVMRALGGAEITPGRLPSRELEEIFGVDRRSVGGIAAAAAIGAQLTRLQSTVTQLSYDQARESISAIVRRLNERRRWSLTEEQVRRVAESALLMHLHPTCTHCHGRREETVPDAPHTSGEPCGHCGGTGQRPYPRRNRDKVEAVLRVIGDIQAFMERAVARRLR